MAIRNLDFTFDMESVDRKDVLVQAAEELDALQGSLGPTDSDSIPAGDQLRAFTEDVVEFAAFPDVYKITDRDFLTRNLEVPVPFQHLAKTHNFYWLYFPVALFPNRNWYFHLLEVKVEFNPADTDSRTRPKAYQILPDSKFQRLLEINEHLDIHIDENFRFSADTGDPAGQFLPGQGEIQAGVDAKFAAGMVLIGVCVANVQRTTLHKTAQQA